MKYVYTIGILIVLAGCYFANNNLLTNKTAGNLEIEMVKIEGGSFMMGATQEQNPGSQENEFPVHEVKVSDFRISKYELTVSQFSAFIDETNYITDAEKNGFSWIVSNQTPWGWAKESGTTWMSDENGKKLSSSEYSRAVVHVTWQDANEFCKWLSEKTGDPYRLPTESEWEFAARGGNKSKGYTYSGSNDISDVAWYGNISENSNSRGSVHKVGELKANEIGLYDLSGNVWEWCSDTYAPYPLTSQTDPKDTSGETFVIRGGGWNIDSDRCRNAERNDEPPHEGRSNLGFRIARDA